MDSNLVWFCFEFYCELLHLQMTGGNVSHGWGRDTLVNKGRELKLQSNNIIIKYSAFSRKFEEMSYILFRLIFVRE